MGTSSVLSSQTRVIALLGAIGIVAGLALSTGLVPLLDGGQQYNLVLISVDTLRQDHMGLYGYTRNTTPYLDSLSDRALVFDNAISQSTWTLPGHASLFTGRYPSVHGAVAREEDALPPGEHTLAEVLDGRGYRTGAVVGSVAGRTGDLQPRYGFPQGFDTYIAEDMYFNRNFPRAMDWLREEDEDPFFLFVHGYDVHSPYRARRDVYRNWFVRNYTGPLTDYDLEFVSGNATDILDDIRMTPDGPAIVLPNRSIALTSRDIRYIRARYDETVRETDTRIREFMRFLRTGGYLEDTVVVIFSEHGENLGDHVVGGRLFGHASPYDHTVRVPLMIVGPDIPAGRVEGQVDIIDLMPTLLDIVGPSPSAAVRDRIQGMNLAPRLTSGTAVPDRPSFIEGVESVAVRTTGWKLIEWSFRRESGQRRLFDLRADPAEEQNLYTDNTTVAASLAELLEDWRLVNRNIQK